jgi:hypothetical protein
MDAYIERRGTKYWIANPSDPRENFADSWNDQPERREAFYDWLDTARIDFQTAAERATADEFVEALSPRMGRQLVEAAAVRKRRPITANKGSAVARVSNILRRILDAPHRKRLAWPKVTLGKVWISSAVSERRRFSVLLSLLTMRGGFDEVAVEAGKLTKKENASYNGSHSIECFIIKDGYCAAQSGPFVINIA